MMVTIAALCENPNSHRISENRADRLTGSRRVPSRVPNLGRRSVQLGRQLSNPNLRQQVTELLQFQIAERLDIDLVDRRNLGDVRHRCLFQQLVDVQELQVRAQNLEGRDLVPESHPRWTSILAKFERRYTGRNLVWPLLGRLEPARRVKQIADVAVSDPPDALEGVLGRQIVLPTTQIIVKQTGSVS